jgi:hypothetical protein
MKKIRVTDIIVIRRDVSMASYPPDWDPATAARYERELDAPEVVESIMDTLSNEEPMVFERTATVVEVRDEIEGADEAVQLTLPNVVEAAKASGAAQGTPYSTF